MIYKRMYSILLGACSDAIDAMDAWDFKNAKNLLLSSIAKAEEIYIDSEQSDDPSFAVLMSNYAERRGQQYISKAKRLNNDDESAIPEDIHKRCLILIDDLLKDDSN